MRGAVALLLGLAAASAGAQSSNPLRVPSLLPAAAQNVNITSAKDEGGGMFTLVEQNGQLPNAQGCEKTPTGHGTAILRVQRYNTGNPAGKMILDQMRQTGAPALEVKHEVENGRANAQAATAGFRSATPVTWEPIEGGQAGWFVTTVGCVQATNAQYQVVDLRAWAVQGPNVIKVVVNVAGDAALAKKYALEMLDKLKRSELGKP